MRRFLIYSLSIRVILAYAHDTYDYVVVGGGTAGLVLANRLSEDADVTVAVIEAGSSVEHNQNVTQIENFFANLNTPIDWQYPSQPQKYTSNRVLTYHSGKALGGTSTINGATYVRAQDAQIDAWEQLGNAGWNWSSLFPYYLKSEAFQAPTPDLIAKGAEYEPWAHGSDGHVHVGWSNYIQNGSALETINQTVQHLGVPYKKDQSDGNLHGFSVWPSTVISKPGIRADAARNYLYSIRGRANLHLFTETLAERIVSADTGPSYKQAFRAIGVQTRAVGEAESRVLKVRKEVILSAGSLKSPVILENSGIGNPRVLSPKGIPVQVDLPSVGENLQDQPMAILEASATANWTGYTPYVTYPTASDIFGKNTSSIATHVLGQLPAYASMIAAQTHNATSVQAIEKQLRIQANLIFNQGTPCAEIISFPTTAAFGQVIWGLLPFSRGSVHLSSTNASSTPIINPNFFMLDWDAILETATANFARAMLHTKPLSDYIVADILPNTTVVPTDAGIKEWLPWFKQNYAPNYHPVGTCAMMSKDLGGVVDAELRVYGTTNVRVVDASVLPFQVDGHLTSTIYAVAERAADIIKCAHLGSSYL